MLQIFKNSCSEDSVESFRVGRHSVRDARLSLKTLMHSASVKLLVVAVVLGLNGCANEPAMEFGDYTKAPAGANLPRPLPSKTLPAPKPPATYPQHPPVYSPGNTTMDSAATAGNYANSPAVLAFIDTMVQKHGFERMSLTKTFAQAKRLESVIRLEMGTDHAPGPPKPHLGSWTRYRDKFLNEEHIQNGVDFWHSNASAIQKASTTYGVDPEYIVGIIGVETYFGRNIGKTCVFDALTTLAFDTPRRGQYFKTELENFLLMAREEGYAPREPVGSWAGAMGLGQFMPSSFRRLAIDFDHNGKLDLWHPQDAIGSVAHYFAKNGWQFHEPVTQQVASPGGESVIDLSTYDGDEFWETFHNFKVIKRYNNSKKYAMAVHQLAQAIKARL